MRYESLRVRGTSSHKSTFITRLRKRFRGREATRTSYLMPRTSSGAIPKSISSKQSHRCFLGAGHWRALGLIHGEGDLLLDPLLNALEVFGGADAEDGQRLLEADQGLPPLPLLAQPRPYAL